ncbi:hypothetical protein D3C81_2328510 [compost metagenome]
MVTSPGTSESVMFLPASSRITETATKAPATRNSPCPKFRVLVVLKVILKPTATSA